MTAPVKERVHSEHFDTLTKAKSILEEHGWCQHTYGTSGRVCALGAVHAAVFGVASPVDVPTSAPVPLRQQYSMAVAVLSEFVPDGTKVNVWNDRRGRTYEDVLGLFDTALGSLA